MYARTGTELVYLFRNDYSLCVVDHTMCYAHEIRAGGKVLYSVRLLWLLHDDGSFGHLGISKSFFAEASCMTKLVEL